MNVRILVIIAITIIGSISLCSASENVTAEETSSTSSFWDDFFNNPFYYNGELVEFENGIEYSDGRVVYPNGVTIYTNREPNLDGSPTHLMDINGTQVMWAESVEFNISTAGNESDNIGESDVYDGPLFRYLIDENSSNSVNDDSNPSLTNTDTNTDLGNSPDYIQNESSMLSTGVPIVILVLALLLSVFTFNRKK